jgi:hypothetical protein
MRALSVVVVTVALLPALALAGMNRNYLVPAYKPCPDAQTTCIPVGPASTFTFEQAVLKSRPSQFIKPNQVSLVIELRGVRDASGALVTTDTSNPADDFILRTPAGRVTLVAGTNLQLEPGSPLSPITDVRVDLKNGKGHASLTTPDETPTHGLITQTLGVLELLDNQGNLLAVTGARSRP